MLLGSHMLQEAKHCWHLLVESTTNPGLQRVQVEGEVHVIQCVSEHDTQDPAEGTKPALHEIQLVAVPEHCKHDELHRLQFPEIKKVPAKQLKQVFKFVDEQD